PVMGRSAGRRSGAHKQMAFRPQIASHADALHFFRNAGDLLDVLERGEVRTDLVKELERQQRKLQSWAEVPGVDQERINRWLSVRRLPAMPMRSIF
ncbi:cell division protein ZapD, partial [Escherichia coli]|uniref:cell division protein ZapD n=1 Tax=Escherichia coli TaxID=562 RepID=UPI00201AF4A0